MQVVNDLWNAIDAEYPPITLELTPDEIERVDHHVFVKHSTVARLHSCSNSLLYRIGKWLLWKTRSAERNDAVH